MRNIRMAENVRGHGADLLLNSVSMVMGLLNVGGAVGLARDVDGVGWCAVEGLLESNQEFTRWGRGHRARHVDVCCWRRLVVEKCVWRESIDR